MFVEISPRKPLKQPAQRTVALNAFIVMDPPEGATRRCQTSKKRGTEPLPHSGTLPSALSATQRLGMDVRIFAQEGARTCALCFSSRGTKICASHVVGRAVLTYHQEALPKKEEYLQMRISNGRWIPCTDPKQMTFLLLCSACELASSKLIEEPYYGLPSREAYFRLDQCVFLYGALLVWKQLALQFYGFSCAFALQDLHWQLYDELRKCLLHALYKEGAASSLCGHLLEMPASVQVQIRVDIPEALLKHPANVLHDFIFATPEAILLPYHDQWFYAWMFIFSLRALPDIPGVCYSNLTPEAVHSTHTTSHLKHIIARLVRPPPLAIYIPRRPDILPVECYHCSSALFRFFQTPVQGPLCSVPSPEIMIVLHGIKTMLEVRFQEYILAAPRHGWKWTKSGALVDSDGKTVRPHSK